MSYCKTIEESEIKLFRVTQSNDFNWDDMVETKTFYELRLYHSDGEVERIATADTLNELLDDYYL